MWHHDKVKWKYAHLQHKGKAVYYELEPSLHLVFNPPITELPEQSVNKYAR